MQPVYIIEAVRTAMGGFQGSLSSVPAPSLGSTVIHALIERSAIDPAAIEEVIMGCVLQAGLGQGPARQAALQAGLPPSVRCTTVNKLCGSGMQAVMQACDAIRASSLECVVAGGMESMSNAPYLLPKARAGMRMGHTDCYDHMFLDGLEDAQTHRLMGSFAQDMADKRGLTRQAMDAFAVSSLERARQAIEQGFYREEVIPVCIKSRKGEHWVEQDEQPGLAKPEKIPQLKPAFAKEGTITAANASSISDGASAVLLASEAAVKRLGLVPKAVIKGYASHARLPEEFTIAPIAAMEKLFAKVGWQSADLYEINEAFAMVTMLAMQAFSLPAEQVNIQGGACALGHPIGATGARLITTLMHSLQRLNQRTGVASLCIGGGEGTAIAVELI